MNIRQFAILAALGAATLVAGTNNAGASDAAGAKTTIIGLGGGLGSDQFCDVITITVFPWHQAGTYDNSCDGVNAIGSGMEGRVTGVSPKDLTIGETYFGDPNSTYLLNIQYPLVTGGSWSIFKSPDGVNFTAFSSGTYTVIGAEKAPSPRAGMPLHSLSQK